jgi:hypothetical protein
MAELGSLGHEVGVVLGGFGQGRVDPMRPQAQTPADIIVPPKHAQQRRVSVQGSGNRCRLAAASGLGHGRLGIVGHCD